MITYTVPQPDRAAHAELCDELAPAFAAVRGLRSKTWLVNAATRRYGAFYVFESKSDFDAFVASELYALASERLGLEDVVATDFAVNPGPTAVTRGPLGASARA